MDDSGPFTLLVWALRLLIVPVAIALGWLALMRRKFGGYDLKDWVVAGGGSIAAIMVLVVASHLQSRYLEAVGSSAQGTIVRKWLEEGDDSTTYKIAVHYGRYEDDFTVGEEFWDQAQPNTTIPVYYDPDYPGDFVPHACCTIAPPAGLVAGLIGTGAAVMFLTFAWTLMRTVERFRKA
jgi:hypothetical protein